MSVSMNFHYFKIEGRDRSDVELKLFVRILSSYTPQICDVIGFVAGTCNKFNDFSYMTGPVEITESEFLTNTLRPDESIYVVNQSGPNEVSSARALRCESDNDYTLSHDHPSVWISIDNISLYITRSPEGVNISAMPLGSEMDGKINIGSITRAEVDAVKTRVQK